jgi:hypothetical protein
MEKKWKYFELFLLGIGENDFSFQSEIELRIRKDCEN